nr:hypothetical protein [Azospirillum argentinense]
MSRPSCLGQHPTVVDLYRRAYGRALRPRLRGVAPTDATPILG